MFAICTVILSGAVAALFFVNLYRADKAIADTLVYTYGANDEKVKVSVESDTAAKYGVVCVDFMKLAEMLDYTVTGDNSYMRFTDASGEWAAFTVGSSLAYVNGQNLRMGSRSYVSGSDLWVPLDFISKYMSGLTAELGDGGDSVKIVKYVDENGVESTVSFTLKAASMCACVSEEQFADPAVEFSTDLSAYEEYMNPTDRDAYLTLVNVDHPLAADYVPDDLVNVADTRQDGRATQQMRLYAEKALEAFFIEMRANNINLVSVTSGYRSYAYQTQLFEQRVAMYSTLSDEEAYATAAAIVAIPGTSEHQSGLCCDMHNLDSADVSFAATGAYAWMKENAHKFGFIIRFPEDKVDITGISFEPWHYRYVGRYHATLIYESGLCLEEYCAQYYGTGE